MTIRCELYDAGTMMIKVPHESPPGMELAYYRELDMEYDFTQALYRPGEIAESLRSTDALVDLAPWPEKFPGVMWVDYTPRYYGAEGGIQLDMYHYDHYTGDMDTPVPKSLAEMSNPNLHQPIVHRADERIGDKLNMEEVQSRDVSPSLWVRMPTKNEKGSTTDLREPAVLMQRAHTGAAFGLEGNYSPIFMPFDLRRPDYYKMVDDNGVQVSEEKKIAHMRLMEGGHYRLYMVPAKWRWVATVVVYYIYVSWFEMFITRQIFTNAWYNRPPIYPIRHNVLWTRQYTTGIVYNHTEWSIDRGVNDGFDRSRGSGTLRQWIIDAQWHTLSEAYIFYYNDPVTLTLWQHPPDRGEVVLGIGRVGYPEGEEERLWLIQDKDVSDRWPNTVIAQYLVPFYVTI